MKKQKSIELSDKKINFMIETTRYSLIRFYPSNMSVDIIQVTNKEANEGIQNMAFAHLPKKIKQLIKPK